jgi:hypothetical protein
MSIGSSALQVESRGRKTEPAAAFRDIAISNAVFHVRHDLLECLMADTKSDQGIPSEGTAGLEER